MLDRLQRMVASTIDYAIIHATVEGVIEGWSGAAERVLGFTAEEVIGKSLSTFFTPEDRQRGLDATEIALAVFNGRSEDDRWHVRKDGSRFWANGVLMLIRQEDGQPVGLCKVLRDKTDVRIQVEMLENQLAGARDELVAERKTVSALAHELRNPLMPIVSALALLQHPEASDDMVRKAGNVLAKQVDVLTRLLDDLNAVASGPQPQRRLELEPVDLNTALDELVEGLRDSSIQRGQMLALVMPPKAIVIHADPARLQQMLLNLLNNALKYTPEGGHIGVSASVEGDMAVVRIEDDGVGMAPEVLPRVFELFTREGRQPAVEGKGVGLAVVKRLAEAHGGFVEARSPGANKGSIFTLHLPMHHPRASPAPFD
ncbi:MAG: PAS domain-containing sensor histidine kinase [Caldimonas sp.]